MIKKVHFVTNSIAKLALLEQDINQLIEDGWQPIGEINIVKLDGQHIAVQQMVLNQLP